METNKPPYLLSTKKTHISHTYISEQNVSTVNYFDPTRLEFLPQKIKTYTDKPHIIYTKSKIVDFVPTPQKLIPEITKSTKKDKRNTGSRQVVDLSKRSSYPYCAVLRIIIEFTNPKNKKQIDEESGTGFLVGPRHLLTAAHCIRSEDWNVWADFISIIPPEGGEERIYAYRVYSFHDVDLALLILDRSVGNEVGWLGVSHYSQFGAFEGREAHNTGFPVRYNGEMLTGKGKFLECEDEEEMRYHINTTQGQSGGPVWIEEKHGIMALGVNTYANEIDKYNGGVRFSKKKLEMIVNWICEMYDVVEVEPQGEVSTENGKDRK